MVKQVFGISKERLSIFLIEKRCFQLKIKASRRLPVKIGSLAHNAGSCGVFNKHFHHIKISIKNRLKGIYFFELRRCKENVKNKPASLFLCVSLCSQRTLRLNKKVKTQLNSRNNV
jgi:hypothetical protein